MFVLSAYISRSHYYSYSYYKCLIVLKYRVYYLAKFLKSVVLIEVACELGRLSKLGCQRKYSYSKDEFLKQVRKLY